ncbi:MAG: Rrf2 family transcriptional regulator [Ruminococcaceae bacterium]|nr:Rrf2 family transcriptional regulator [Oscillospiraceae bacterium]
MLLRKEHDYAIRIIRVLYHHEKASLDLISKTENISRSFVGKVASKLRKAGLIVSKKGPSTGGYFLNVPADEISLYDIVCAVDGDLYISECLETGEICERADSDGRCSVNERLWDLQNAIINIVKENKLGEIFRASK